MSQTLTWNDVESKIEAQAKKNFDFYTSPRLLKMAPDGTLVAYDQAKQQGHELGFNEVGLAQLATKVGVPTAYARKLAEQDTELLSVNVNRWIKELPDKDLLIRGTERTDKETGVTTPIVRAMLSGRYGILDNDVYVRNVRTAFESLNMESLTIQELWMSDTTFHLRLTDKTAAFDAAKAYLQTARPGEHGFVNKEGDPDFLFPMLHLGNSEVGFAAISLEGGVYRVVCTNGLVRPYKGDGRANQDGEGKFKKRHYGFDADNLSQYVVGKATEILRSATKMTEQFAETQAEVVENPTEVIERLVEKHKLQKNVQKDILAELGEPTTVSKYDLINAVTAVARTRTPETRIAIERVAANFLSRN